MSANDNKSMTNFLVCNDIKLHAQASSGTMSKFWHEPSYTTIFIDFSLTVKATTLIFISGRGSAISSAKEGK